MTIYERELEEEVDLHNFVNQIYKKLNNMISQTLDGIENSLDILEERCDTLEENGVNVDSFRYLCF